MLRYAWPSPAGRESVEDNPLNWCDLADLGVQQTYTNLRCFFPVHRAKIQAISKMSR